MGSVQFGIPRELTLVLKKRHGLDYFFETGTLVGHTAQWASEHFKEVVTVDINQNLKSAGNIFACSGDSAEYLKGYRFLQPHLFWLDAHTNDVCRVLEEIQAINDSGLRHVILVDDARLFGTLPAWPSKQKVMDLLDKGGTRIVYEFEDVLVAEPCP